LRRLGKTRADIFFGYRPDRKFLRRPDSLLFKQEYVARTQAFFEKHGGKTLIYAKFVPIVRTFAPLHGGRGADAVCAGFSRSRDRRRGLGALDDAGGLLPGWIPVIRKKFRERVVIGIVLVSVMRW